MGRWIKPVVTEGLTEDLGVGQAVGGVFDI